MNKAKLLLKYIEPYKWSAVRNIIYNILSAVFALVSYTLVIPFLQILFDRVGSATDPGAFQLNLDYLGKAARFYLYDFIDRNGEFRALMLVCVIVVGASLLKNGFIFLANNSMAFIRASVVRDLRRLMYDKVLRLQISFFSDARKGDVMTRISNDVQEIEISVVSSLTMMFRDPLYILLFVIYLFVASYQLTLFFFFFFRSSGRMIGRAGGTLGSLSFVGKYYFG